MKMFKRIAALALSAVMAAGLLATPAMATGGQSQVGYGKADPVSITITRTEPGTVYHVYKLFDVYLANNDPENPQYVYGLGAMFDGIAGDEDINYAGPWEDFITDPDLGGKYLDVELKTEKTIINGSPIGIKYQIAWKEELQDDPKAAHAFIQAALKYAREHQKEIDCIEATVPEGADQVKIDIPGRNVMGYYLVDTTMGSLCMIDTKYAFRQGVTIEEKNIKPQLEVNIWENYTDDGTYVTFGTKSANVGGTDYAAFSFGDTAYMTAEITIGNGEGTMDYLLSRCEYDGSYNHLRPYHSGGFGYAESNLLSVAKWDEESGKWVKLKEGEGWMYQPVWEASNFVFDSASGDFILREEEAYGLTYHDYQIWLNSFDLKPGDKVAVTWKYIAMGSPTAEPNYGGWYSSYTHYKGWHQTYDNWKDENGLGGYGCTLVYGVPDQAWKDWNEEKTYYQTTDGAGKEGIQGETLFKLEDTDGALYSGVQILKTDEDGNPLSGAEFELYWDEECKQPVYFAWNNYEGGDGRYYMSPDKAYDMDVHRSIQPMIMEALDADGSTGKNNVYCGLYNAVCDLQYELFYNYNEEGEFWEEKTEYENFLNYGGSDEEFAAAMKLWEDALKEKGIVSATLKDDGHGLYTLVGLKPGTYYLKETKAPIGYNKLAKPEAITVKAVPYIFSYDEYDYPEGTERDEMGNPAYEGEFEYDEDSETFRAVGAPDDVIAAQIPERLEKVDTHVMNLFGAELPSTGGIGTTIFYVVGGLLVVGAGILLVVKKRMNDQ